MYAFTTYILIIDTTLLTYDITVTYSNIQRGALDLCTVK